MFWVEVVGDSWWLGLVFWVLGWMNINVCLFFDFHESVLAFPL